MIGFLIGVVAGGLLTMWLIAQSRLNDWTEIRDNWAEINQQWSEIRAHWQAIHWHYDNMKNEGDQR